MEYLDRLFVNFMKHESFQESSVPTANEWSWQFIPCFRIICKSSFLDNKKKSFFKAAVESILFLRFLSISTEQRLNRRFVAHAQKCFVHLGQQHLTKQRLNGNLLPIISVIRERRTYHTKDWQRNEYKISSDPLFWKLYHGLPSIEGYSFTLGQ